MSFNYILAMVSEEHERQLLTWGIQNHPEVDPTLLDRSTGCPPWRMVEEYEIPTASRARFILEDARSKGSLTWTHVLVEEVAEVVEAATNKDKDELVKELVQVAAVAISFAESVMRNK